MSRIGSEVKRALEEKRFWQRMCGRNAILRGFSWKDSAVISVNGVRIEITQAHLEWARGLLEDAMLTRSKMSLKAFLNELYAAKVYKS